MKGSLSYMTEVANFIWDAVIMEKKNFLEEGVFLYFAGLRTIDSWTVKLR